MEKNDLLEAAWCGDLSAVAASLAKGQDVHTRTRSGRTPLQLAASLRRADIACLLLFAGADANTRDDFGGSSLGPAKRGAQDG